MTDVNALIKEAIAFYGIKEEKDLIKKIRFAITGDNELDVAEDVCSYIDDHFDVKEPYAFCQAKRKEVYEKFMIPAGLLEELPIHDGQHKELVKKLDSYIGEVSLSNLITDLFNEFNKKSA